MNDPRDPRTQPPDDGELLSAWLAGDLDEAQSERVERRLATEPHLAAQLDATVDLLVALGGLDRVEPPPEYGRRLRARLEAEQRSTHHEQLDSLSQPLGVVSEPLRRRRASGGRPGPRQARQREQRARFPRWPAVAAVLLVLSVIAALPLLRPSPAFDAAQEEAGVAAEDDAASVPRPEIAEQPQPPVVVEGPELAGRLQTGAEDSAEADADEGEAEADQASEADAGDLRERFTNVPEATELLGRPVGEATTTAATYTAAIEQSPVFSTGAEPAACLDAVTGGAPERVPVRVEAFSYEERPALAYVVVKASEGAVVLDRVEVWVVDPDTCDTEAFVSA